MAVTLENTLTERFSGYLPLSYEVSVPVDGGLFVMPDDANPGKVKLATTGTTRWLGVARYFGKPGGEFDEVGGGRVRGLVVNEPVPRTIACPHFGVYDLVNAGLVTIRPGDAIQVIDDEGRSGRAGSSGNGTDPAAGAIVGWVLGLAAPNNRGATTVRPVAPGQKMRVRLGRS